MLEGTEESCIGDGDGRAGCRAGGAAAKKERRGRRGKRGRDSRNIKLLPAVAAAVTRLWTRKLQW